MKPLGMLGLLLAIAGAVILAMGGVRYLKDKDTTNIGPVRVTTSEHGFITPLAGAVALGAGLVLLVAGKDKSRA
jgi:hypothetical protein